jgi:hypothetical protein
MCALAVWDVSSGVEMCSLAAFSVWDVSSRVQRYAHWLPCLGMYPVESTDVLTGCLVSGCIQRCAHWLPGLMISQHTDYFAWLAFTVIHHEVSKRMPCHSEKNTEESNKTQILNPWLIIVYFVGTRSTK